MTEQVKITDPVVVRGKGRPPSKRKMSAVEKVVVKKKGSRRKTENKIIQVCDFNIIILCLFVILICVHGTYINC